MTSIAMSLQDGLALADSHSDPEIIRAVGILAEGDPTEWCSAANRAISHMVKALRAEGIPDRKIYHCVIRMHASIPRDGLGGY